MRGRAATHIQPLCIIEYQASLLIIPLGIDKYLMKVICHNFEIGIIGPRVDLLTDLGE